MLVDQLFLRTLEDLDRRTTATDEYEALLAAGLLRKLLLDEAPLVHQVNRYRRERIRFRINGETPLERTILADNPVFWAIGDAIDPDAFPGPGLSAPMEAKLDQFLARTVMSARGERLSVGDLVKQLAHIDGAVHKGKPTNAREQLLDEMSRFMFFRDLPVTVHHVQLIGRIVVRALTPLHDRILADKDAPDEEPSDSLVWYWRKTDDNSSVETGEAADTCTVRIELFRIRKVTGRSEPSSSKARATDGHVHGMENDNALA